MRRWNGSARERERRRRLRWRVSKGKRRGLSERTIRSQVSQRESRLTLNLETWTIHQHDEALYEFWLGSSELLSVGGCIEGKRREGAEGKGKGKQGQLELRLGDEGRDCCRLTIDGDVTESGGTVVLNVGILRVEKSNENRDGSSGDELLSILVCSVSIRPPTVSRVSSLRSSFLLQSSCYPFNRNKQTLHSSGMRETGDEKLTRVGHVQQSSRSVPLNPHVLGSR